MVLDNGILRITARPEGAELTGIFNSQTQREYLWQAGPEWPKTSPLLFPVVGELRNGKFRYNGNEYPLKRHGFAREMKFELLMEDAYSVTYRLESNDDTFKIYPFEWRLDVSYRISGNMLSALYIVSNTGKELMYYSIGAHPAFNVPLQNNESYTDYLLEFDHEVSALRWPIIDGLISTNAQSFLLNAKTLKLDKLLFEYDAIVIKNPSFNSIALKSDLHKHGLKFHLDNCPYLGLWAAKGADFICIEPWQGIADAENSNQDLREKEGIIMLSPGESRSFTWRAEFF